MSDYHSFWHGLWYGGWRRICQVVAITAFRIRCFGRENVPSKGGALLASNHQSFFDPMIAALGLPRQVHYLARDSLFHQPAFAWLISSLNAFPVKRNSADLAAIKESLRRLKDDQLLLLFGEGTRTYDGRLAPLQPGMAMMARKAKVPLIPVVIDGAFEAWPRSRKLWRFCTVRVMYGQPVSAQQIAAVGDKTAAKMIFQRQQQMQHQLRSRYGKKPYFYPPIEA